MPSMIYQIIDDLKIYKDACLEDTVNNMGEHFLTLFDLVYSFHNKKEPRALELGTGLYGGSLFPMAIACKYIGGKVYTVDHLPVTPELKTMSEKLKVENAIEFIRINDNDPSLAERFSKEPPFDVILLDSSHQYDHTKKQLETYLPFLKPQGYLATHDTDAYEFTQRIAIQETISKDPEYTKIMNRTFCCGMEIYLKGKIT